MPSRHYLLLECALLFIGLPLLLVWFHQRIVFIALLWGGARFAYWALQRHGYRFWADWNGAALLGPQARAVWVRCVLFSLILALFTWWVEPGRLFSFPLELPYVWAAVMVLYPVLSVIPQELIFRAFFLTRYKTLLPQPRLLVLASALAFSFAHLVFGNVIALSFTLVGGLLFADTYRRHRSLALVSAEHALYGCVIFTLGLGWYFYGAAWK